MRSIESPPSTVRKHLVATLAVLILLLGLSRAAAAHTGSVAWGPWRFDWEVKDNAGLALRNVKFKERAILYKASVPVIRVRYQDDRCGPYADQINWDNLLSWDNCGGAKVCQKTMTDGGRQWLMIAVLAGIGKYRITQTWWLSDDGWIHPRMSSKGLHCDLDHEHHAYWRMDFDMDGAGNDQIFTYNKPGGGCGQDEGWGPGWHEWLVEAHEIKVPELDRRWLVQDHATGNSVSITAGNEDDGNADAWAFLDMAGRRYQSAEDVSWPFGAGELGYENGESVQDSDDVFWAIAHLYHKAAGGGDQWHRIGPWIWVNQ